MNQLIGIAQLKRASVLISRPIGIAQIKRASVLIGNHLPIGKAQSTRVTPLMGNHQSIGATQIQRVSGMPGSRISNGIEEQKDLNHENIYKGFMTTKITSDCDRLASFVISDTCLVLL